MRPHAVEKSDFSERDTATIPYGRDHREAVQDRDFAELQWRRSAMVDLEFELVLLRANNRSPQAADACEEQKTSQSSNDDHV